MSKDEPGKVLSSLKGAYALVWYDEIEKRVYFICDNNRPLHALETENFYVLVSEKELADWILSRNNIEITKVFEIKDFDLHYIDKDGLYFLETIVPKNDFLMEPSFSLVKVDQVVTFIPDKIVKLKYPAFGGNNWKITGWLEEDSNTEVELFVENEIDIKNKLLTIKVRTTHFYHTYGTSKAVVISTDLIKSEDFLEGDFDDDQNIF